MDEEGEKMSKLVGNGFFLMEIIYGLKVSKIFVWVVGVFVFVYVVYFFFQDLFVYGVDVFRLWVVFVDYISDVFIGLFLIFYVNEFFRRLCNIICFFFVNIFGEDKIFLEFLLL